MNLFLCVVSTNGEPVPLAARSAYLRARCCTGLSPQWYGAGGAQIMISLDREIGLRPSVARHGSWLGVGTVRLDNRLDVARLAHADADECLDIELILRAVERVGVQSIPTLVGDFAFVLYDARSRLAIAARDAFGIKTLYWREHPDRLVFSSRAELLADGERYDDEYVAEYLTGANLSEDRTIYAGVRAIPPGAIARGGSVRLAISRYWNVERFTSDPETVAVRDYEAKCDEFRELLTQAVRVRLTGGSDVWAQLSGGLDSSSIVSVAASLAERRDVPVGIGGTVTIVDSHGTGSDERHFSDTVVRRYGLRNEQVHDFGLWQDDGAPPPATDQPSSRYPFYARDRYMCTVVRDAGGRVLLGGHGSDLYLTGTMFFFADWLVSGRAKRALREMARWAALGEVSFWRLALRNAVMPLLPARILVACWPRVRTPSWIGHRLLARIDRTPLAGVLQSYGGAWGSKYAGAQAASSSTASVGLDHGVEEEMMELRYPFLHRPLMEFCLRLPPELCAQPLARKWILRQAMRGMLPETVRTRRGKGSIDGRIAWSFAQERQRLDALLRDPILAQLGCVDVGKLRVAVDEGRHGEAQARVGVFDALALETWLQVRSGRWTSVGSGARRRAVGGE
jgi:asparagine synthase (glutamine-hydrolysing)